MQDTRITRQSYFVTHLLMEGTKEKGLDSALGQPGPRALMTLNIASPHFNINKSAIETFPDGCNSNRSQPSSPCGKEIFLKIFYFIMNLTFIQN